MKKWSDGIFWIYCLVVIILVYLLLKWPYTPEDIADDLKMLGPVGFVIDILFVLFVFRWLKKRNNDD
tara:strand:- start:267 stop:467 length:201 start_codon:yes stop_codon:yes gene_type:complete